MFNANISFAFQAIQKLSAHFTNLYFGVFCKFLGDFWGFLGKDSFSQRISKLWRYKIYSLRGLRTKGREREVEFEREAQRERNR